MKIRRSAVAVVVSAIIIVSLPAGADDYDAEISAAESAALDVVARRTAAYNSHDIEAFIAAYDENVRIYEYPDRFLGEGTERMRRIFGLQFSDNDGLIVVHAQHALENVVVSDETVTFYGTTEHNIGVYTIEDGLIVEVRLIEPTDAADSKL
jgi:hypothetical protein